MSSTVITSSYDKHVRFWDTLTWRTTRSFTFAESQINCMALSPDRCRLLIGAYGLVRAYDVTASTVGAATGGGGGSSSSSGGGSSGPSPPQLATFEHVAAGNFTAVGFVPVHSTSAPSSSSSTNGGATTTGSSGGGAAAAAYLAFACSEDGAVRLLDQRVGHTRVHREAMAGSAVTCAALLPGSQLLLVGTQMSRIVVWHVPSLVAGSAPATATSPTTATATAGGGGSGVLRPLQELSLGGDRSAIRSIAAGPLGTWAAVATNAGRIHILRFAKDIAAAAAAANGGIGIGGGGAFPRGGSNGSLRGNDASQNNSSLLVAGAPAGASGGDLPSPTVARTGPLLTTLQQQFRLEECHAFQAHQKYILRALVSPNGRMLATCSADYTVGLWTVPPLLVADLTPTPTAAAAAAASAEATPESSSGRLGDPPPAAAAAAPTTPAPSGAAVARQLGFAAVPQLLSPRSGGTAAAAPAPAATSAAATATAESPLAFAPLPPLAGHTRWVWDCAFAPDSAALVTVGSDNHVRVWAGLQDARPRSDAFFGHTKPVTCVLLDYERRAAPAAPSTASAAGGHHH